MLKLDESPFSAVRSRAILDRLRSLRDDSRRVVIRGATVITMDPMVPDLVRGNVHLSGRFIERIEPCAEGTEVPDGTIVVPAKGCIVIPDCMTRTGTAGRPSFEGCSPQWTSTTTSKWPTRNSLPSIGPRIYIATLLAGLAAINGGVTSLLDFAHNTRSAAHADASLQAIWTLGLGALSRSVRR